MKEAKIDLRSFHPVLLVINFNFISWYLLHETEKFLSRNFEVKDMGEVSYVIGIEIFHNRS